MEINQLYINPPEMTAPLQGRNHSYGNDRGDTLILTPNYIEIRGGEQRGGVQVGGGIRGKVTEFSKGSRIRLMKRLSMYWDSIVFWQHITFEDTIFEGKSFDEIVKLSAERFHRFADGVKPLIPGYAIVWRKEYEPRKSGALKGSLIPHYHLIYVRVDGVCDVLQDDIDKLCRAVAVHWVRINNGSEKMARVAQHKASWQKMTDAKHASRYVSKYIAKSTGQIFPPGASLGRFWGVVGQLPDVECLELKLENKVSLITRRYLRRYAKAQGYKTFLKYKNGEKNQIGTGYIFMSNNTQRRLMNHIYDSIGSEINYCEMSHIVIKGVEDEKRQ